METQFTQYHVRKVGVGARHTSPMVIKVGRGLEPLGPIGVYAYVHSFVTSEPRDFKFGTLTYHSKSHPADEKSSLKGS